jgi:hypothetical protein
MLPCLRNLCGTGSKLMIDMLVPDTLYGVRTLVRNAAGEVYGSILLATTLSSTMETLVLEFEADFATVFGITVMSSGLLTVSLVLF